MSARLRMVFLAGLVAFLGLFGASSAFAQSEDLPLDAPEDCVENVMDLPALNVCKDAQGRHLLNLPAIGTLREPLPETDSAPDKALPRTGLGEDLAVGGLAALAIGAVLTRRLRMAAV
jgi:hypothetical protein